jgi:hypothetical protein
MKGQDQPLKELVLRMYIKGMEIDEITATIYDRYRKIIRKKEVQFIIEENKKYYLEIKGVKLGHKDVPYYDTEEQIVYNYTYNELSEAERIFEQSDEYKEILEKSIVESKKDYLCGVVGTRGCVANKRL